MGKALAGFVLGVLVTAVIAGWISLPWALVVLLVLALLAVMSLINPWPGPPTKRLRALFATLDLTQEEIADRIGVSRYGVNQLVNGRRNITPEMALRLERFLGDHGFTAETWLRIQAEHDLAEAGKSMGEELSRIRPLS